MYATMRKWRGMHSVGEIAKRAEKDFAPVLQKMSGFQGYYLMDCGGGVVVTISVFDTRESALASNEKAVAFAKSKLADLVGDAKPDINAGEVLVSVSA